jgi:hypothetical protein
VDLVPDPLLLRKSGSSGNRNPDLWICSQNCDHEMTEEAIYLVLSEIKHVDGQTFMTPVLATLRAK